jgi:oligoribonuclease
MKISSNNLIWIDLEMTGLEPKRDRIIEIAVLVTDKNLNKIDDGIEIIIHQNKKIIDKMDQWNTDQHGKSGLTEKVLQSKISVRKAEQMVIDYISQYVPFKKSPMCGSSVYQDRRFLFRYMQKLEDYFHYRTLDVSTIKILAKKWFPDIAKQWRKNTEHRALSDINDSVEELKFYREHLFFSDTAKNEQKS